MADWDVIAKQRLSEDWATLRGRLSAAEPGDAFARWNSSTRIPARSPSCWRWCASASRAA